MDQTLEKRLRAHLRLAQQHAHTTDAERGEMEAQLLRTRAEVQAARAHAARTHASIAAKTAALRHLEEVWVRWFQNTQPGLSIRDFAQGVGGDLRAVLDEAEAEADGQAGPGDDAWGTVWLHGNWRYLTSKMTTPEREHAADAVARWSAALHADDPDLEEGEPEGLRWWREA